MPDIDESREERRKESATVVATAEKVIVEASRDFLMPVRRPAFGTKLLRLFLGKDRLMAEAGRKMLIGIAATFMRGTRRTGGIFRPLSLEIGWPVADLDL